MTSAPDSEFTVFPLPHLVRMRVTGTDRVRFLHNFCTADVNGLAEGTACEAFFTNVKARIIAHGWILAGRSAHEIWMLPGCEKRLLDHLNRYIITEDVVLESLSADQAALAGCGRAAPDGQPAEAGSWRDISVAGETVRLLSVDWGDRTMSFLSGTPTALDALMAASKNIVRGSEAAFERQRILARVPLIGQDLTDAHLAPEAFRDRLAISYTKGCYLGQEPIARLDALGQIQRVLACVEIRPDFVDAADAAELTSLCDADGPPVGLAVVRVPCVAAGTVAVRLSDGTVHQAIVRSPDRVSAP